MNLTITSITGHGDQRQERVMLRVEQKCDLGFFMLADTTFTSAGKISNKVRHTHWFANREVAAGDTVCLFTGEGTRSTQKLPNGSNIHFEYWGLLRPVWNDGGDAAVLFDLNEWKTTRSK